MVFSKKLTLFLASLFVRALIHAQELPPNHYGSLTLDKILLSYGPAGVGYEHFFFTQKSPILAAKAGIGINWKESRNILDINEALPVYLGGSLLVGNKGYFEVGFLFIPDLHNKEFVPLAGFRYLNPSKLFSLRVFAVTTSFVSDKQSGVGFFVPIAGLSIGYLIN